MVKDSIEQKAKHIQKDCIPRFPCSPSNVTHLFYLNRMDPA